MCMCVRVCVPKIPMCISEYIHVYIYMHHTCLYMEALSMCHYVASGFTVMENKHLAAQSITTTTSHSGRNG